MKKILYALFVLSFSTHAQDKGFKPITGGKAPAGTERRLALVVGNKDYRTTSASLQNPGNDADDMASALDALGFTVIKKINLDRVGLERSIDDFGRQLKAYDVGLFYYSGHGVQQNGENYLVPTDADMSQVTETEYQCVKLGRVFGTMEGAASKVSIVLLDACRNNPFPKGSRGALSAGLTTPNNPPGTFVAFATRAGNSADDNSGQHNGLFTGELLKYLTMPGLGLRAIMDQTITGVRTRSGGKQIPGRYDELEGDFVFVQKVVPLSLTVIPSPIAENQPALTRSHLVGDESVTIDAKTEPTSNRPISGESNKPKNRLALIIGNADYASGNKLANPSNDADDMSQALSKLGFDVMTFTNLTGRTMRKAIDEFGQRLQTKKYQVGLFYYSGHGVSYNGKNYLVPIDAQLKSEGDIEFEGYVADRVLDIMAEGKVTTNIVVLDACLNNPFSRNYSREGLTAMMAPNGTFLAFATAPGKTVDDGTGRNGIFTEAFLRTLAIPNLTIESVFKRVRNEVMIKTSNRQTPWDQSSLTGEDFYFLKQ